MTALGGATSLAFDQSQAAFEFTGLDQTFVLDRSKELSLNMGGRDEEAKALRSLSQSLL
jgi:hypothetical protein